MSFQPDPRLSGYTRQDLGEYSIQATTGRPGEEPFIEFFDELGNRIGHVDIRILDPEKQAPLHVVVPRLANTEKQHRTLDRAVEKLREFRKAGNGPKLQYDPISIAKMDLVSIVQRMKPKRAKSVLELLARTLERELEPERRQEKQ